jgi:hypothetical protein
LVVALAAAGEADRNSDIPRACLWCAVAADHRPAGRLSRVTFTWEITPFLLQLIWIKDLYWKKHEDTCSGLDPHQLQRNQLHPILIRQE